jgi:hypothetical protein
MERRNLHKKHPLTEAIISGKSSQKIAVFDLDETLIISSAQVQVLDVHTQKVVAKMSSEEFNHFKELQSPKYKLSYKEFEDIDILRNSTWIFTVMRQLLNFYNTGWHVGIITARSDAKMIKKFFDENGIRIHTDLIYAVNDPAFGFTGGISVRKKQAIHQLVDAGYKEFIFFDDHDENLILAKEVENERGVTVKTVKV